MLVRLTFICKIMTSPGDMYLPIRVLNFIKSIKMSQTGQLVSKFGKYSALIVFFFFAQAQFTDRTLKGDRD